MFILYYYAELLSIAKSHDNIQVIKNLSILLAYLSPINIILLYVNIICIKCNCLFFFRHGLRVRL